MKTQTLEKIALELFQKYGYRAVTMDMIAEKTRVSKKTLYEEFSSKSQLVSRCTQMQLNDVDDMLRSSTAESKDAIGEVMTIMSYFYTNRNLDPTRLSELRSQFPEAYVLVQDFQENVVHGHIAQNLRRGQGEGIFREDFHVDILASYRLASMIYIMDEIKTSMPMDKFLMTAREISDNFLRGLLTPKGQKTYEKYLQNND